MPNKSQVVDEGHERTKFAGGGEREIIPGKGRFDLIPPEAIEELARHYEAGAMKYADRNWERGLPLSTFYNSLIRHITASYMRGNIDENHEAAAHWNTAGYLTTLRRIQKNVLPCELDDRPVEHCYKGHDHRLPDEVEVLPSYKLGGRRDI